MMSTDEDDEYERKVAEQLASRGVTSPVANPDRARTEQLHEVAQQVTGAPKAGGVMPTGRPLPSWTRDASTYGRLYGKTEQSLAWLIGTLGGIQTRGSEVVFYMRQDPTVAVYRGKLKDEPVLSDLDVTALPSIQSVKIVRDTGGSGRKETTTVLLTEVVALTEVEKPE